MRHCRGEGLLSILGTMSAFDWWPACVDSDASSSMVEGKGIENCVGIRRGVSQAFEEASLR